MILSACLIVSGAIVREAPIHEGPSLGVLYGNMAIFIGIIGVIPYLIAFKLPVCGLTWFYNEMLLLISIIYPIGPLLFIKWPTWISALNLCFLPILPLSIFLFWHTKEVKTFYKYD
jgi:hypothetical protein